MEGYECCHRLLGTCCHPQLCLYWVPGLPFKYLEQRGYQQSAVTHRATTKFKHHPPAGLEGFVGLVLAICEGRHKLDALSSYRHNLGPVSHILEYSMLYDNQPFRH